MTAEPPSGTLPRRDLIVLPLISLLTILLMTGAAELLARRIWVEKDTDDCFCGTPSTGERHKANCVMEMKNIEGPWVRYEMNSCGYRGTTPCGPKPPGTLRLAIIGTSASFGLHVPYDKYFLSRVLPQLSSLWGHPVELQNLGDIGLDLFHSDSIPNEALSLKPDALFYMVVPFDLLRGDFNGDAPVHKLADRAVHPKVELDWGAVRAALKESRCFYVAQHFMLQDDSFFLRAFANYADPNDVSRVPEPLLVTQRLARMDFLIGRLADDARRAGVPLFVVPLPNRVEADLISKNIKIPNIDPYVFPDRIKEISRKHGAECIDMVPAIRRKPEAEQMFYSVDGHPNEEAHALMAEAVVDYFRQRGAPLSPVPQESAK